MNILAAFFLIGLLISGIKAAVRYLHHHLGQFNTGETFILHSDEMDSVNLLSMASNETNRRDTNYIRVTSTSGANDRIKRLAFSVEPAETEFDSTDIEVYHSSLGKSA